MCIEIRTKILPILFREDPTCQRLSVEKEYIYHLTIICSWLWNSIKDFVKLLISKYETIFPVYLL